MKTAPVEKLHQALALQQTGRLNDAARLYGDVLEQDPRNADALHLLGMVAFQLGKYPMAVDYIARAIEEKPSIAPFYNNFGAVLEAWGRSGDALPCFEHALVLDPDFAAARVNLGNALQRLGRFEEAVRHYRRALQNAPDCAEAHNNLGNALVALDRPEEALAEFNEALRLQPGYAEAHTNMAGALRDLERLEEAERSCRQALRLNPALVEAHNNLGAILLKQDRPEEAGASVREALNRRPGYAEALSNLAAVCLRQKLPAEAERHCRAALSTQPRLAAAHNALGTALHDLERPEESEACFREALELRPTYADAWYNLGNLLSARRRQEESERAYDEAVRLRPGLAKAHWNRALLLLERGDFKRGFEEYEWRWKRAETPARRLPGPQWDGKPAAGRTILLYAEQGLGDTIQFIRYAPLVKQRGAKVVVECQPRLIPLLETCAGIDTLAAAGSPLPEFDAHLPLLSLPRVFGTEVETIPAAVPYLAASPAFVKKWRARLAAERRFRVGLVWAGNPDHPNDRERSFSAEMLLPLAEVPGVALFSLQRGAVPPMAFEQLETDGNTVADTAAILANLDLVISADTMVAHLAGALARPAWVLLWERADWRWLDGRDDSPWYPTLRLFRQRRRGDWGEVVARVARALREAAKQFKPPGSGTI